MNAKELFEIYKSLNAHAQVEFENLYNEYRETGLMEEHNKLDILGRRLDIAQSLQSIYDEEGKPYFDMEWVFKKILRFSDEEIAQAKLKK
jgi:hypothetical protein